jgi:multidrug efflux system outer membrane protein
MAENQLKAANANIGAARAAFFPTISLTTSLGTMDSRLSGLFKPGSEAWSFAPQIVVPIFDYGARRASLKVSKVDREICLAQYEKAIQVAFKEVNDALVQRQSLREQGIAQRSLTQATDATYRLTKARYDVGMEGSLSVLDAQRTSYASQQALIALRRAELGNLVTLYKVLGGGANPASEQLPGKP